MWLNGLHLELEKKKKKGRIAFELNFEFYFSDVIFSHTHNLLRNLTLEYVG